MQWQPHRRRWKTQMRTNVPKDLHNAYDSAARTQEIVFDRKMMENLWRHMLGSRCWNNHLLNLSKFKSDFSKLTFFMLCCFRLRHHEVNELSPVFISIEAAARKRSPNLPIDFVLGPTWLSTDERRCEKWIQGEMDTLKTVCFAHHHDLSVVSRSWTFCSFKVVIHHFKVLIVSLARESYVSALFINCRSAIFSLHLAREASITSRELKLSPWRRR